MRAVEVAAVAEEEEVPEALAEVAEEEVAVEVAVEPSVPQK